MNAPGPFTDMTAPVAVHELSDNPDNIQLEEKMYDYTNMVFIHWTSSLLFTGAEPITYK